MHAGPRHGRFGSSSLIWLTVAVCALGTGCAAGSSSGSDPNTTGAGGTTATATGGTGATGSGGSIAPRDAGSNNPTGGTVGADASSGGGGSTGAGGFNGTGGSTASGGGGTTGSGAATGGGGTTGAGGKSTGAGGTTGYGGSRASGGSSGSGTGGATGTGGAIGTGGATGTGGAIGTGGVTGTGGATTSGFCPSGAIFCADFEEASGAPLNNPVGAATFEDPNEPGATFGGATAVMDLDASGGAFDGKQSLRIDPSSGVSVRTLVVAVPATFWVRLYIKSDMAIGQPDHNSFFGAGTDPVYSMGNYVELSEQNGCVLLNKSGMLYPTGTTCGTNGALSANSWHCMTAEFDGTTGNVHVYAGATQIINAAAWTPATEAFNSFSFGYFAYNPNGATVWYDDVVISAGPLSCP